MTLDLTCLHSISSVTPAVLAALAEAAFVMLRQFHDTPPTDGVWHKSDSDKTTISVIWTMPTEAMLLTHGNEKDATEEAAYAVAIAIADAAGFKVIGRTAQGSGSDWLMIPKNGPHNDFYKLEVSGIARGGAPKARLETKVSQGKSGDLDRPGFAVVVRFADVQVRSESWR
jgi:hypothetical protein